MAVILLVRVNLFYCAFVPAESISVGNFELPRRKGRGRGGSFSETSEWRVSICAEWLRGWRAEPWTPVAAQELRVVYVHLSGERAVNRY